MSLKFYMPERFIFKSNSLGLLEECIEADEQNIAA